MSSPPAAEPRLRFSEALFAIEPALKSCSSWDSAAAASPTPGYAC
jgi:hypothetical protein